MPTKSKRWTTVFYRVCAAELLAKSSVEKPGLQVPEDPAQLKRMVVEQAQRIQALEQELKKWSIAPVLQPPAAASASVNATNSDGHSDAVVDLTQGA